MKKLFTLICIFAPFATFISLAQVRTVEKITLKGAIHDSLANKPVPYATVALLENDTTILNAVAADRDGKFRLVTNGGLSNLTLWVSCIGYLPVNRIISPTDRDLGIIHMEQSSYDIDDVSVVGLRPIVETEGDKIVYNVQSDPTAEGSQLIDILRKVPMLSVSGLDEVELAGSKKFAVLINGRRSNFYKRNLNRVINSIPASAIQKIEVTPSTSISKNEDDERGALNIVYDRDLSQLFAGNIGTSGDTRGGFGTNLFFLATMGKFSFSALVDYSNKIISPYSTTERFMNTEDKTQQLNYSTLSDFKRDQKLPASLDFVYDINDRNTLNLTLSYDTRRNGSEVDNLWTNLDADQEVISKYSGIDLQNDKGNSLEATLFYQHQFKSPDHTLSAEYIYGNNNSFSDRFSTYRGIINYENSERSLESKSYNNQHYASVDYANIINKVHDIEAGVRFTSRDNVNNNTDRIWLGNEPDIYPRFDSKMDYSQQILVAYGSYGLDYKKLRVVVSGRLEATFNRSKLNNNTRNIDIKSDYFNFVPRISVGYSIKDHWIRVYYTQRLFRPAATALDPYVDDTDPNHITYGNPNLKTVVSHDLSAMWFLQNSKIEAMVLYYGDFYNNNVHSYTVLNNAGKYETTYKNMGHMQQHSLIMTFVYRFSQTDRIGIGIDGTYTYIDPKNGIQKKDGYGYGLTSNGSLKLWKNSLLYADIKYKVPSISLQSVTKGYLSTSISLDQKLFNKKLNLKLTYMNPLNKVLKMETDTKGINYLSHNLTQTREIRNVTLSVIYRFGDVKYLRKPARSKVKDDSNSLILPENGTVKRVSAQD